MCLRLELGATAGRHPVLPENLLIDRRRGSWGEGGGGRVVGEMEERGRGGREGREGG